MKIYELCSNCGQEIEIEKNGGICKYCGKYNFPCSLCDNNKINCNECKFEKKEGIKYLIEGTKDGLWQLNAFDFTKIVEYKSGNVEKIFEDIAEKTTKKASQEIFIDFIKNDLCHTYIFNDLLKDTIKAEKIQEINFEKLIKATYKNYILKDAINAKTDILYFYTLNYIQENLGIQELTENDIIYFETFDFGVETIEELQKEIKDYFKNHELNNFINDLKDLINKYEN